MKFLPYWQSLNKEQKLTIATKLQTNVPYLSHIAHGRRNAGAKLLLNIEQATDGLVSQRELRDI
ncbi:MAG: hypothetical protein WC856_02140 [Methylococcaceae bacterium]|jgi:DNA-binding transcriptional regulator YdaS (Cro superfamily)